MVNPICPLKRVHCLLYRRIHFQGYYHSFRTGSTHRAITSNAHPSNPTPSKPVIASSLHAEPSKYPLSLLPFIVLVRSYLIAALSSSSQLLTLSLYLLSKLSNSRSRFLNLDRSVFLRCLLKNTIYAHFCAGENPEEVKKTVSNLKRIGYRGVILAYAKETLVEGGRGGEKIISGYNVDGPAALEVETWKQGNLDTVKLAEEGDFVAVKFTGAGNHVVQQLSTGKLPGRAVEGALTEICELAKAKGIGLLIDSEQNVVQGGIELWTLQLQKRYNTIASGKLVVYGTYQAYLRSTPAKMAQHLDIAKKQGFVLGIKLVRGAYMNSDPRQIFWSSKEATDRTYDGIAKALIRKEYNNVLAPAQNAESQGFPEISLVLATHNRASVQKAIEAGKDQENRRKPQRRIAFGQLMGMADEVSCELVLAAKRPEACNIGTYKYLPWGTVGECLKYLLRRAEENKDAVERAREGRSALRAELARRIFRWT